MPGINKVILVGHVAEEPFIRTLSDGTISLIFFLVTVEIINRQGNNAELIERHQIAYRPHAEEFLLKCFLTGRLMFVEGMSRVIKLVDGTTANPNATEVKALRIKMLE